MRRVAVVFCVMETFQLAEPGKEFQTYSKNHFKRTAAQAKVLEATPQERNFTLH
jgi:hypothetical protein